MERPDSGTTGAQSSSDDFIVMSGFLMYPASLVMAAVEGLSYLYRPLGIIAYSVLLVVAFFFVVGSSFSAKEKSLDPAASAFGLAFAAVVLISFGQLSRTLQFTVGGYAAGSMGYWEWTRYGIASFLDGATLGMPSAYGWKLSSIQPVSMTARTTLYLFQVILQVVVITTVVKHLKAAVRVLSLPELAQDFVEYLFEATYRSIMAALGLLPFMLWVVAVLEAGLSIRGLLDTFAHLWAPLLALWVTWTGLQGLRLSRTGDKVLAFVMGAAGAVWLFYSWSGGWAFLLENL